MHFDKPPVLTLQRSCIPNDWLKTLDTHEPRSWNSYSRPPYVSKGSEQGSSSERTRTAITAALCKKLKDLMGEFQNLRLRLQDEYRCALNFCQCTQCQPLSGGCKEQSPLGCPLGLLQTPLLDPKLQ